LAEARIRSEVLDWLHEAQEDLDLSEDIVSHLPTLSAYYLVAKYPKRWPQAPLPGHKAAAGHGGGRACPRSR